MAVPRRTRAVQIFFNSLLPCYIILLLYASIVHPSDKCTTFLPRFISISFVMTSLILSAVVHIGSQNGLPEDYHIGEFLLMPYTYCMLVGMSYFAFILTMVKERDCFKTEIGIVSLVGMIFGMYCIVYAKDCYRMELERTRRRNAAMAVFERLLHAEEGRRGDHQEEGAEDLQEGAGYQAGG